MHWLITWLNLPMCSTSMLLQARPCLSYLTQMNERLTIRFIGNGGTQVAGGKISNVAIDACDFPKLIAFAQSNNVRLVIPGPEQPLVEGIQNAFPKGRVPVYSYLYLFLFILWI